MWPQRQQVALELWSTDACKEGQWTHTWLNYTAKSKEEGYKLDSTFINFK